MSSKQPLFPHISKGIDPHRLPIDLRTMAHTSNPSKKSGGKLPATAVDPVQKAEDLEQARQLILQVSDIDLTEDGNLGSALWRLTNAAGIISRYAPGGPVGKDLPTGRGFKISHHPESMWW